MTRRVLFLFPLFAVACGLAWGQDEIAALRARAESGNLSAQLKVARAYFLGLGVAQDETEGIHWFFVTAGRGEPQSQRILGLLYELGGAVLPHDDVQAEAWFRKAAERGDAIAETRLGVMYENGRGGLPQDAAQAASWYRKAAGQGATAAQNSLGQLYEHGRGVRKDEVEALSWYRKAAAQGDVLGLNNEALLCITSQNADIRDPNAALNYALAAVNAKKNDPLLLSTLAQAYYVEGRFEEAVRTQTSALALISLDRKTEYRTALNEYQQALDRSKEENHTPAWNVKTTRPSTP
jgi:TPR repeat protein